ncbi:SMC family ATPase [Romeria aff. gracilis LEGE 07310]|uniref:Nuclease SbcCD subunit C n=1 Tax=Vasconcelosia minhoensis LEGE 07310 TaxID=915328 RepID=A0A8J7AS13_9CYAN|nr:SMC family ATPase [Romeria gracilis]MBE9079576.1 SMC family ATPase [Romeria aff. gracilis LEGE 07310]
MIPKRLTIRNFLSYRDLTLDFSGLHVACICGPNGAGKSSLLEAIAWAVWGQSRVAAEDDIVYQGQVEATVDFVFTHSAQTYRVLRSRRRNQGSTLEFQVEAGDGFRVLTQRGMRATQQQILQHLKIDYDTFVNSAYLRQGRADEFMLKRPRDRKQVLADLLKLDHYDRLGEQAREQARDARAQVQLLETAVAGLTAQLQQRTAIAVAHTALEAELAAAETTAQDQQQQLSQLRHQQQQRQGWQQQLALEQQQLGPLEASVQRVSDDRVQIQQQMLQMQHLLDQAEAIGTGYQQFQQLQAEAAQQGLKFQTYQPAQAERSRLQQQTAAVLSQLQADGQAARQRLADLDAAEQEQQQILSQRQTIQEHLSQLQAARTRLRDLDQRQLRVAPLRQRQRQLQAQIERAEASLSARLEAIQQAQQRLQAQQTQQPELIQAAVEVTHRIDYLEQRRSYQEDVRQKGSERRGFMERLQADQRNYEAQMAQLDQKIQLLSAPEACCPLCDQPLDPPRWDRLLLRHRQERSEIQDRLWVIREQLTTSEREIQVLRREYRELETELAKYAPVLQQRGQLQARLDTVSDLQSRLHELTTERQQLTQCLADNRYAEDLQAELGQLEQQLEQLPYDDRDHALARSQVDRLRWAEVKQASLQQAERRLAQLQAQRTALEQQLAQIQAQLDGFASHPLQQQLAAVEAQIAALDYDLEQHQQLRLALDQARVWQASHQALAQAQQQQPGLHQRLDELDRRLGQRQQAQADVTARVAQLQQQLDANPDPQTALTQLEAQRQTDQAKREQQLAQLGRLQQQLAQFEQLQAQLDQQQQTLQQARRQQQVYQSLADAFGPNGIQALMIENLLPQLEAVANQILGRLSAHQLHVQFVTQRAGRSRHKLIDTLDILIADPQGTRAYETYSGGEAFRVNFAIRLALARLLAQRSGTALQMLIIDEGFGTQDQAGCDRLVAAINAIASDFACILTITHMPHFREAFQTRIDVCKTATGSQIEISG